jgi:hypothetical protein
MNGFKDEDFLSASEKEKILADWTRFLKNGLKRQDFTKRLYHHLHQHCDFIAHYNQEGFFSEYFLTGDDSMRFLEHFDRAKLKNNWWSSLKLTGAYSDLNNAMIDDAAKYLPVLYAQANAAQKKRDLTVADALLSRYGLTLTEAVKPASGTIQTATAAAVQGSLF